MGQCIGNCVKCEMVAQEEKIICCSYQTLRQCIALRTELKELKDSLLAMKLRGLSEAITNVGEADVPAAIGQEQINPKRK